MHCAFQLPQSPVTTMKWRVQPPYRAFYTGASHRCVLTDSLGNLLPVYSKSGELQ